jgi:hypothetical protein
MHPSTPNSLIFSKYFIQFHSIPFLPRTKPSSSPILLLPLQFIKHQETKQSSPHAKQLTATQLTDRTSYNQHAPSTKQPATTNQQHYRDLTYLTTHLHL